ncbi:hypothetical protein [Mesorhizobium sp. ANAO-SY3R2]|uniref:hypothetical protein n=1 Tax=Mesorhizobium sp. ANAO-SY3R2 TaxID=3166644 RepID=UPI00366F9920
MELLKQNVEKNRAAEARQNDYQKRQMEEQAAILGDPANWPVASPIPVKWASWLVNQHNKSSLGLIYADEPLVVINRKDGSRYEYSSIEELVQTWTVD